MPLPEGFNEVEFTQDLIRKWQNRLILEEFRELGGADWDPDINVSKGAVRHACTHKDTDPIELTLMRLYLYYFIYRKCQDLQQPYYGTPTTELQERVKFKPQVMLYYQEPAEDVEPGFNPLSAETTFRLMDEQSTTLTKAKLQRLAERINSLFSGSTPFKWRKGKELYPYNDWDLGYRLKILARDETEAKRVIRQVLEIRNHVPDWKKGNKNKNLSESERYPIIPESEMILGERVRLPRQRGIGEVVFQYALIHIHGKSRPLCWLIVLEPLTIL
jgi:hypothetical protein